jgi:hypothetical protein
VVAAREGHASKDDGKKNHSDLRILKKENVTTSLHRTAGRRKRMEFQPRPRPPPTSIFCLFYQNFLGSKVKNERGRVVLLDVVGPSYISILIQT